MRAPPAVAKGMRPEVREETAREVEVALVEVEFTIVRLVMVEVAAFAKSPPLRNERPETVSAVEEAYGKMEAERVEVAVKRGAVTTPVKTPAPVTESGVPGEVVPTPTFPPRNWAL